MAKHDAAGTECLGGQGDGVEQLPRRADPGQVEGIGSNSGLREVHVGVYETGRQQGSPEIDHLHR
ncbi:hypothetical protein AHiyo1_35230 [Arthrobacter sp. Hiyo1]|nr:hypothetical protein AHiyo1_35230 [Arthrobacter sp. Hiyo1]